MEYGSWLRQRRQLEQTATRHPEPEKRSKASAKIKELDKTYNRNKSR